MAKVGTAEGEGSAAAEAFAAATVGAANSDLRSGCACGSRTARTQATSGAGEGRRGGRAHTVVNVADAHHRETAQAQEDVGQTKFLETKVL